MKTYGRAVRLGVLLGVAAHVSAAEGKSHSSVVRTSLAGSHLEIGQVDTVKFDAKARYYLIRVGHNWESPGADLLLCPAADLPFYIDLRFFKGKVQRTALAAIRTGWGVNIGDTPTQVRRKLGAAPQRQAFDAKSGIRTYSYERPTVVAIPVASYIHRKPPVAGIGILKRRYLYTSRYTFYKARLRTIEYRVEDPNFEC